MALFDKLRQELDRAGRTAQRAIDESRMRLDLYRARQSTDRFAQRLGYAVYRAKKAGAELGAEEYASHVNNLAASEAEVSRLETLIAEAVKSRPDPFAPRPSSSASSASPPASSASSPPPPSASSPPPSSASSSPPSAGPSSASPGGAA